MTDDANRGRTGDTREGGTFKWRSERGEGIMVLLETSGATSKRLPNNGAIERYQDYTMCKHLAIQVLGSRNIHTIQVKTRNLASIG